MGNERQDLYSFTQSTCYYWETMTPFQALQYNGEKTEVVFALVEFIVSGRGFQILPHSWCPGLTQHVWGRIQPPRTFHRSRGIPMCSKDWESLEVLNCVVRFAQSVSTKALPSIHLSRSCSETPCVHEDFIIVFSVQVQNSLSLILSEPLPRELSN